MHLVSCGVAVLIATLALGSSGSATVIPVSKVFFTGSPVTTFNGLANGTEVNGLTSNGILFNYLVGGTPTNGQVIIDGGPGPTNNVSPPNVVSIGNHTGTLLLTLPTTANALGYGFADLAETTLSDATTITLFSGNTTVGSLVYSGSPDPVFTGGFAGIESTVPFNRVGLNFSASALAFAVDNIVFTTPSAVPEPGTLLLVATGIGGVLARRRLFRSV
jgi:hypothetical protein